MSNPPNTTEKNNHNPQFYIYEEILEELSSHNYEHAENLSTSALKKTPMDTYLLLLKGESLYNQGFYAEALEFFKKSSPVQSSDYLFIRMGDCLDKLRQPQVASTYYMKTLNLNTPHKGYVYNKLSRLHTLMGNDKKAYKYENLAVKYSDTFYANIKPPSPSSGEIRQGNRETATKPKVKKFQFLLVLFALLPLISSIFHEITQISPNKTVEVVLPTSEVVEVAIPVSEDTPLETRELPRSQDGEIYADEQSADFYDYYALYDYDSEYDYTSFGNTNSNIIYDSVACQDDGLFYYWYDSEVIRIDDSVPEEVSLFSVDDLKCLNAINDQLLFIKNPLTPAISTVAFYSLDGENLQEVYAPYASNLLTDSDNAYYITKDGEDSAVSFFKLSEKDSSGSYSAPNISYLNQTEDSVYFISDEKMYRLPKDKLYEKEVDAYLESVKETLTVDFLVVEGNYLYYSKTGLNGLYRNSLGTDQEVLINSSFNPELMNANVYMDSIYLSSKDDLERDTIIIDKSGAYLETQEAFSATNVLSGYMFSTFVEEK